MKTEDIGDRNWYVLFTKPRHEKKVADRLTAAGYTTYCPLHKIKRQWSDRVKVVEEPLFKSFIFIHIENAKRREVFAYPGTLRYLFWLRNLAKVRPEEIETIQKWLGHCDHEELQIEKIDLGSHVRIISGQFLNLEAILLDRKRNKALVQLTELGIQLSLNLKNNEIIKVS